MSLSSRWKAWKHQSLQLPLWLAATVVIISVFGAVAFAIFFALETNAAARWSAICVGIGCSSVVTLLQLVVYADDITTRARLERLHIVDLIERRGHHLPQIADLIKSSNRRIFIIGNNAQPILVEVDLASAHVGESPLTLLESAIKRGVQVRILIADANHQNQNVRTANGYPAAKAALNNLEAFAKAQADPSGFDYHEFTHNPSYYLVVADENVVAGVTFPNCSCPDEPAIHYRSVSPIAQSYIRYFVDEWIAAGGTSGQLSVSRNERPISQLH